MSNVQSLGYHHRTRNYTHQDEVTHNFVLRNCSTFLTPKQLKRLRKKENAAAKRSAARFGMLTRNNAPF